MKDDTILLPDGRRVGFADYGNAQSTPLLWCHGGPGSRLEPATVATAANRAGLRLIGIDRPGYGKSTPKPGRTIASWVPDAVAVADYLGIGTFATIGISTGGAYALALAASCGRVTHAFACCALTDMRWAEGKAMIPANRGVWNAKDRKAAMAIVAGDLGEDGSKMIGIVAPDLPPADKERLTDPEFLAFWQRNMCEMFAHGVAGYADDRIADGTGWGSFDVSAIRCPVVVMHGKRDTLAPVAHAHHTAAIVPGASLRLFEGLGHFSIIQEIVGVVRQTLTSDSNGVVRPRIAVALN